jgi:thiol-disulfide isomerase/thioredoxin
MALTPSTMLTLGTIAPDFTLLNVLTQQNLSLQQLKSATGTVIIFMCNHCPYVKHILPKLIAVAKEYQQNNIQFIGINSNDAENYPEDSPENMRKFAKQLNFPFSYLYDESQEVAKAYQAACTPDFYLFDDKLKCVYRGRFDGATPGNQVPVTGNELIAAMNNLLAHQPINNNQQPSVGCNIKWKY